MLLQRPIPFVAFAVLAGLCATSSAPAQSLNIETKMEHSSFVQHEPILLSLTVENQGGSPYIVDDYGEHNRNVLAITVKSAEDGYLPSGEGMHFGQAMVMPGTTGTFSANLLERFGITKQGRYFVQVTAKRGDELAVSRLLMFDVVNGIEIGSISRPLPEYDTVARRYTLLYWPRDQVEVLFLRIDETPPGRCVGIAQLGNIVRFVDPKIEFAADGTLTVVHQSSRDLFIRTVLRTDRDRLEIVERQRLLDPNQSPLARAAVARDAKTAAEGAPDVEGFTRRPPRTKAETPAPDATPTTPR